MLSSRRTAQGFFRRRGRTSGVLAVAFPTRCGTVAITSRPCVPAPLAPAKKAGLFFPHNAPAMSQAEELFVRYRAERFWLVSGRVANHLHSVADGPSRYPVCGWVLRLFNKDCLLY